MSLQRLNTSTLRQFGCLLVLGALGLLLALARRNDPFRRLEFVLKTHNRAAKAVAILPNEDARFPVMIYVHPVGGNMSSDTEPLRQFAELGIAAVGIECDQTSQTAFDAQFAALQQVIYPQLWAQSNAVAWVGVGCCAQRMLEFALTHPQVQPQVLVHLSGGWDDHLQDRLQPSSLFQIGAGMTNHANQSRVELSRRGAEIPVRSNIENPAKQIRETAAKATEMKDFDAKLTIHFPVLFVHSDDDAALPLEDTKSLAAWLETNGISVDIRFLHGVGQNFGADWPVVLRETAEYCRSHLPPADYAGKLAGCQLNETERQRFNLAMQRAGGHQHELWNAVVSSREPERRTVMMIIGGLEDYDLSHVTASYLEKNVHMAWQARRTYPWCRNTPLDIFEKYVAGTRFFQEPIENWRPELARLVRHEVKYCRTTQEASDRVWKLMNENVAFNLQERGNEVDPIKILQAGNAGCLGLSIMHAAIARSVGLPERVTRVLWQNSSGEHFCVEIWSAEDHRWHEIDVSAGDRAFGNDWVMRVPKTAILAPRGDRGVWDGLTVGRWSSFTNTISMIYPSGDVVVRVLNHGVPAKDQTVGVKLPTVKGLIYMALARTDLNGEARLTLGRSAQYPYLFFVLPPDEAATSAKYPFPFLRHNFGEETWKWVQVQSGRSQEVILDLQDRRRFDPDVEPPGLSKSL